MENDKRLERIVAKDKGYSAPRCAYCTDEIKEEEDAKFSTLSDGKRYPVHKACDNERKEELPETREELTERVRNQIEYADELEKRIYDRTHTSGKRAIMQLAKAVVPGFGIYEVMKNEVPYQPTHQPASGFLKTLCDLALAVPVGTSAIEGDHVLMAGAVLSFAAIKSAIDYTLNSIDTKELKQRLSFAKDYSSHLQEKLAQMPPDKADDKKTS